MANPSPTCQVKEGSGAWQDTADGVDVTAGSSLTIRLVDTSPYFWSLECIGADETLDVTSINAGLSVNNATKQATLTAPSAGGSALLMRSTINGGVSNDGAARASYSTTFKISVPTNSGLRVGAFGETTENDSASGATSIVNKVVRALDVTLNVKAPAFGAVGDGITDDTAAFVAVFARKEALVALGFTVRIYIPAGQYKLTAAIDVGTRAFTLYGDGSHYVHQNTFGDAAWGLVNDYANGVVGSVLRWTSATDGLKITSYPAMGIRIEDLALIGPGTGTTTGFYEAAAGGVVDIVLHRLLVANWYRGIDIGGAEETRVVGCRVFGCVYGVPIDGTPQLTGGPTNSSFRDLMVQQCTVGVRIRYALGLHFEGGATLFQANGKTLTALGATNASPIVVQVASTVGLETGIRYDSSGFVGNTAANVTDGTLTVVDATHISLDGTTGNGDWTSGGTIKVGGGVLVNPEIVMLDVSQTGADPAVTLTGTPVAQGTSIEIDITLGGARGTAQFTWKLNGAVQASDQLTAATFALGATGLTANFPVGTYTNGNEYTARSYGGGVTQCSLAEGWMEANARFGLRFDMSAPGVSAGMFTVRRMTCSTSTDGISFTIGTGSGVNRLGISDSYLAGSSCVIPATGVYGYDTATVWGGFTNNNPASWKHEDAASGTLQVPTVASNGAVTGTYFGCSIGNIAASGVLRGPSNATLVAARNAANNADLRIISTDNVNDVFFGNITGFADAYLQGTGSAYIGNSTSQFALQVGANIERHAYPQLGGGAASVPNSVYGNHGLTSVAQGDADATIAVGTYSRESWEFTGAQTADRTHTAPTPSNADGYYEKTVVNLTTGGFDVIIKCGVGTTVRVPPNKTKRLRFKSTGDVSEVQTAPPGGTFTLTAAVTTTVTDKRVTANSVILLTPTNAAAATLMGSAKALYLSARTAQTSFAVSTANAVAAAGTETFQYAIFEAA